MISEYIDPFQANVYHDVDCCDPCSLVDQRARMEKGRHGAPSRKRSAPLNQDVAMWITQGVDPENLLDRMSKVGLLQGDGYGL